MSSKRSSSRNFHILLCLSLLVHSSAMLALYMWPSSKKTLPTDKTVTVQITRPEIQEEPESEAKPEAPEPEELLPEEPPPQVASQEPEPEVHMPSHNAEEFASRNQDKEVEGEVIAGGGTEAETKQTELAAVELAPVHESIEPTEVREEVAEIRETEPEREARELVATNASWADMFAQAKAELDERLENSGAEASIAQQQYSVEVEPTDEELSIPAEFLDGFGNLELLSDGELSDASVADPFSENESNELRLVNRYLERMTKQVRNYWINPYKGGQQHRGIIKLRLSTSGELIEAYVFRSSGLRLLDISVLDAIKAVPRYEVPENEIITARYYSNLSFHYSSIEEETELMPFETAQVDLN